MCMCIDSRKAVWHGTKLGSLETTYLGSSLSFVTHPPRLSSSLSLYFCICKMVIMEMKPVS